MSKSNVILISGIKKVKKGLQKWEYYSKHAKKYRVRKKYQNKIKRAKSRQWKPLFKICLKGLEFPPQTMIGLLPLECNSYNMEKGCYTDYYIPNEAIWNLPFLRYSPWNPYSPIGPGSFKRIGEN